MKYIQIAGFMPQKIKAPKELTFVANPSIDIEKMEAKEITGFDFNLPNTIFDKFYQDDDYEIKITENIESNSTIILVEDSSVFNIGDNVWLKNEVIEIVSISSSTEIIVIRGRYNTFAQKYTMNEETQQYYYIRKYPKTFIGQRVFLWENDKLLSIGLIKEQPEFNNSLLEFNCVNAIESLDINFTFPPNSHFIGSTTVNGKSVKAIPTSKLNEVFIGYNPDNNFQYEIPPIRDYIDIPLSDNIIIGASNISYMILSELPTILEYLNLYAKINAMVFTWDYSQEKYTFINISDVSSLDSIIDVTLGNYKNIEESYSSKIYTGISQILIKLWNTSINANNTNTSQFANKDVFELDLSKIYGIEASDIYSIVFYYIRLFSIIYSELTIPTHSIKFEDFQEGHFYNILDIDRFYTFQDVSSKAFCLSKDENEIKFLIVRNIEKNMIAPALTGEIVSTTVFQHDNTIKDFLETTKDNVEEAKIDLYDYPYFYKYDKVMFIKNDGTKIDGLTITSITSDLITITGGSLNIGDKGYFTYDNYSVCGTRQRKFFFLDINEW